MPQFHFHFREGDVVLKDDSGIVYESVEEAYLGAFEAASDLWRELLRERRDPLRCAFEVADAAGQPLFVLPFAEILETCQAPRRHNGRKRSPICTEIRQSLAKANKSCHELRRELKSVKATLAETRALIAQADIVTKGPVQSGRRRVESV